MLVFNSSGTGGFMQEIQACHYVTSVHTKKESRLVGYIACIAFSHSTSYN